MFSRQPATLYPTSLCKILGLVLYLSITNPAFGVDSVILQFDSLQGAEWHAQTIVLELQRANSSHVTFKLQVAKFTFSALKKPLENITLTCQRGELNTDRIACAAATLQISGKILDQSVVQFAFSYHLKQQRLELNEVRLFLAGGQLRLQGTFAAHSWNIILHCSHIAVDKLLEQLNQFVTLPFMFNLKGNVTFKLEFTKKEEQYRATLDGQVDNVYFANQEGTQAGEKLQGQINLTVERNNSLATTNWHSIITLHKGELYIDPVYLQIVAQQPLTVATEMVLQHNRLQIKSFTYTHLNVVDLQLQGNLVLDKNGVIESLTVRLYRTELNTFYAHYLAAWFSNKPFGQLQLAGNIAGEFRWLPDNTIYLAVELFNVDLEDTRQRFGLYGLNGVIQWHNTARLPTHLRWLHGYIASKVPLGASEIHLTLQERTIELLQPWQQPFLDGILHVTTFKGIHIGKDEMQLELHTSLEPVSMQAVSAALDFPKLNGEIATEISAIHYHHKRLEIDGKLLIYAFDGNIEVHSLQIQEPFGAIPILSGHLEVKQLNLKKLTDVTQFGEIQGQLSGWIKQLYMVKWQLIAFDAYFATPANNQLPLRISQKAVSNLTNIGEGGAADLISRSILSIFKNFSYQKLGLGCRLQNGICAMYGIEPAANGYYIVKGSGLPRINVIGHNQRVDWQVLVERLKNMSHLGTPIIK